MGSKNLKAVVVRGSGTVAPAAPEALKETLRGAMQKIKEHGVTGQGLPTYGTAVLVNILHEAGGLPTNNFSTGRFEGVSPVGYEASGAASGGAMWR